jgi:hypothetical protein
MDRRSRTHGESAPEGRQILAPGRLPAGLLAGKPWVHGPKFIFIECFF